MCRDKCVRINVGMCVCIGVCVCEVCVYACVSVDVCVGIANYHIELNNRMCKAHLYLTQTVYYFTYIFIWLV